MSVSRARVKNSFYLSFPLFGGRYIFHSFTTVYKPSLWNS